MERLTWRTTAGTPNFEMTEAARKDNIARSAFYQLACEKLADYEDSGLEPKSYAMLSELVTSLQADIADLRNENCLKCGRYKTAHEGSCEGCRWKQPQKMEGK